VFYGLAVEFVLTIVDYEQLQKEIVYAKFLCQGNCRFDLIFMFFKGNRG